MVRLDDGAFAEAGFNNVRIDGALDEEVDRTDLLCFFFKYSDKFFAYNLTFLFRLCNACKLCIETFLSIYSNKVKLIISFRSKYSFYLVAFIFSE